MPSSAAAQSHAPAPGTQEAHAPLSPAERERYEANYLALFGGASDTARRRWDVTSRHGRADVARLIEDVRIKVIHENRLDLKVQQLVHFAQLLALGKKAAAEHHAQAALKAGASVEELLGVVETAFITGGVPAYSIGIEIISEIDAADAK